MNKYLGHIILFSLTLILFSVNHFIARFVNDIDRGRVFTQNVSLKGETARSQMVAQQNQVAAQAKNMKPRHALVPDDPEKYGMIIIPEEKMPRTPEDWEAHLRLTFEKNKILESPEAKEIIAQMNTTPEEHAKHTQKLNNDIEELETMIKNDPFNQNLDSVLQVNYKLKALNNILKEVVVKQGDKLNLKSAPAEVQAIQSENNLQ